LRYRITLCPNVETLSLHIVITLYCYRFVLLSLCIVIALYCYRFGHMGTHHRFFTVIATGKLVALSLLKVIAFGILERLSLFSVKALGILEALSLLKVTPWEEAKSDNV
jgi:hypothetical protein